ncbi:PREDICTED: protein phosphatase 1 regulatory subunit 14A [Dipodomys ordii]|uniref:Protein phosphatase 1 regulatory subunit 14 n=1 Tax=Dipodomys ordii TaxID=10020 RepID=A0A1S3FZ44_DIPOR|nr:PREDICTED: protein phosphatase 1 regulatory subunit 14A [Dipodomys ordii]
MADAWKRLEGGHQTPRLPAARGAQDGLARCALGLSVGAEKEADMPDEVNIDELLELESEEERRQKIQRLLQSCMNPTEDFIQELLTKLQGLHKQPGLRQPSPSDEGSLSPRQDRARTAPP